MWRGKLFYLLYYTLYTSIFPHCVQQRTTIPSLSPPPVLATGRFSLPHDVATKGRGSGGIPMVVHKSSYEDLHCKLYTGVRTCTGVLQGFGKFLAENWRPSQRFPALPTIRYSIKHRNITRGSAEKGLRRNLATFLTLSSAPCDTLPLQKHEMIPRGSRASAGCDRLTSAYFEGKSRIG